MLNIELDDNDDVQSNFDTMYNVMSDLLDQLYPNARLLRCDPNRHMSCLLSR